MGQVVVPTILQQAQPHQHQHQPSRFTTINCYSQSAPSLLPATAVAVVDICVHNSSLAGVALPTCSQLVDSLKQLNPLARYSNTFAIWFAYVCQHTKCLHRSLMLATSSMQSDEAYACNEQGRACTATPDMSCSQSNRHSADIWRVT